MDGLQVGAAKVNINPPLGHSKGGYRLFAEPISSIDEDIDLGVIVLRSLGKTVAIVASDLGNSAVPEATEIRERVADILGIARESVLFNLSHNHSAPCLGTVGNNGNDSSAQEDSRNTYFKILLEKIDRCTRDALQSMRPARMAHGWGQANLNIYRREWQGGQDVLGEVPGHPVDDSVGVIRFDDLNGKAIATFFRFSCHPVVNGAASPTLSADFPGPAKRLLEEKVGGLAFFLQGCGGNLNPRVGIGYERDCSESVYKVGTALGGEAVKVALGLETHRYQKDRVTFKGVPNILFKPWQPVTTHVFVVLAGAEEIVPFRFSPLPSEELLKAQRASWMKEVEERTARGALSWEIRVAKANLTYIESVLARAAEKNPTCDFMAQALRIGDVVLVGLGVEAFFETGEQIRKNSPWPDTFVLGYSNGTIMYLPRKEDFPKNGWKWPNSHALPDLLPQVYCQPALWHPDSEQEAVAAALRAIHSVR